MEETEPQGKLRGVGASQSQCQRPSSPRLHTWSDNGRKGMAISQPPAKPLLLSSQVVSCTWDSRRWGSCDTQPTSPHCQSLPLRAAFAQGAGITSF